jgi:hypothetical protein
MNGKKGLPSSLQLKLLGAILEFMIRSGLSEQEVRGAVRACLAHLAKGNGGSGNSSSSEAKYVGNGNVSAELIRLWTRDGRFMDRDARPKPLPLSRGRSSLVALIGRLDPAADPYSTVESMKTVGLIRELPSGRYIPTAESVKIDRLHPLAVEHVAKSLIRMVTTVCRNTDPGRHSMPLIERYAYVPDLSRTEMKAFADFTRTQGMAYLESVDDWLQQRRVRGASNDRKRGGRSGTTAGVHLVAYLGDPDEGSRPTAAIRKTSARPTPASAAPA